MSVPKAAFQGFVDWCTQPDPAAIFVRRVGALLYVQPKDDSLAFADYFQGTLAYQVPFVGPARFQGVLRSSLNEYWTLDIKLFDLAEVSLVFPNGAISETGQINQAGNSGAPDPMELTFEDDQAAYTLDLLEETVIDWSRIMRQRGALVSRAGAGRKTA
jgi:hypothetical protein